MYLKLYLGYLLLFLANLSRCNDIQRETNSNEITYEANSNRVSHNVSDAIYYLWTRNNGGNEEYYKLIPEDPENLMNSPFKPNLPTYIKYHGFNGQGLNSWILGAKTALLEKEDCNVISVDYSKLAVLPYYIDAIQNIYKVGSRTASLIDWFSSNNKLINSKVHITGHSLGAHAASFSAKYVTTGKVGRVTGLDPAGPLFYEKDAEHRIDKSDADFVDIIHVNSGTIAEGCIALYAPHGHVDFYVNGGKHQAGCVPANETNIEDWMDLFGRCSHSRVGELWVESILATEPEDLLFKSWPCKSWEMFQEGQCQSCNNQCLNMGFNVDKQHQGSYYLKTKSTSPYANGDNQ